MVRAITWIYSLLIVIVLVLLLAIYNLSSSIIFPEKYPEVGMCGGVVYPPGWVRYPLVSLDSTMAAQTEKGKTLFEMNCESCHSLHSVVIGPALKGIEQRRSRKWLYRFIKSPARVINSGDRYAIKLAKEYEWAGVMSDFSTLSKQDIDAILDYCKVYTTPIP